MLKDAPRRALRRDTESLLPPASSHPKSTSACQLHNLAPPLSTSSLWRSCSCYCIMASQLRGFIRKFRTRLFNLIHRGQAPVDSHGDSTSKKIRTALKIAAVSPQATKMSADPVVPSADPAAAAKSADDDERPRGRTPTRRINSRKREYHRVKENHKYDTFEKSVESLRQHGIEAKQWN